MNESTEDLVDKLRVLLDEHLIEPVEADVLIEEFKDMVDNRS